MRAGSEESRASANYQSQQPEPEPKGVLGWQLKNRAKEASQVELELAVVLVETR